MPTHLTETPTGERRGLPQRRGPQLPTRRPSLVRREETTGSTYGLLALIAFTVVTVTYLASVNRVGLAALLFAGLCFAAAYPFVARIGANEDFDLKSIMMLGFALRLGGAYFRFIGAADSKVYHDNGMVLAGSMRQFSFGVGSGRQFPGTGALDYLSGISHVFSFDDFFGSMLVFTLLSFIGACLFYRAFSIGFPSGDHRRYALLVFLLPTLVYWPSSLGKDAWMQLGLGLTALGTACVFNGKILRGLSFLLLGMSATALIRPHVALMCAVAVAAGAFATGSKGSKLRGTGRVAAVSLLIIGGGYLANWTGQVLKVDSLGAETVDLALSNTEEQTSEGGASFEPTRIRTPMDFPVAFVTVMFRPLPHEAREATAFIAATETVFVLALFASSWRRLARLPRQLIRVNYLAFAAVFILIFVFAFSSVGNFGILARQRAQVLPFFLVFLALPAVTNRARRGVGPAWRAKQRNALRTASPGGRTLIPEGNQPSTPRRHMPKVPDPDESTEESFDSSPSGPPPRRITHR